MGQAYSMPVPTVLPPPAPALSQSVQQMGRLQSAPLPQAVSAGVGPHLRQLQEHQPHSPPQGVRVVTMPVGPAAMQGQQPHMAFAPAPRVAAPAAAMMPGMMPGMMLPGRGMPVWGA